MFDDSFFISARNVSEAHNVLHGGLGFLQVPFPLTPENACNKSVTCPMIAGNTYIYRQTMTCPSFAPSVSIWYIYFSCKYLDTYKYAF
jgi:hypothetical protein